MEKISFNKSRRKFRSRKASSDEDHDASVKNNVDSVTNSPNPTAIVTESAIVKKVHKVASSVSFDLFKDEEEEEEEVFQVKKSNLSLKLTKNKTSKKSNFNGASSSDTVATVKKDVVSQKIPEKDDVAVEAGSEINEGSDDEEKHQFQSALLDGKIPDARTIHLIRQRRMMARETGTEPGPIVAVNAGYIPVTTSPTPPASKGRLVREDDDDRSDDEHLVSNGQLGVVTMGNTGVSRAEADRQALRDDFIAAEHGSGSEESDSEHRQWEQQQIRKGIKAVPALVADSPHSVDILHDINAKSLQPLVKGLAPDTSRLPAVSADDIKRTIVNRITSLEGVLRARTNEIEKLANDLKEARETVRICGEGEEQLEKDFRFYQETRGFVKDLLECLNEKMYTLQKLERKVLDYRKEFAQKLINRRRQDVKDEAAETRPGGPATRMDITEEAWCKRSSERESRRSRRRIARERNFDSMIGKHYEGTSTDDEQSTADTIRLGKEMDKVTEGAEKLFQDVVEDFFVVSKVLENFRQWRKLYKFSYREAYVGMCLPKLLAPLVRCKLLLWNPLQDNVNVLESMDWLPPIAQYSVEVSEDVSTNGADSSIQQIASDADQCDIRLLSVIVEKTVLPRIEEYVTQVWDPCSLRESQALVSLVQSCVTRYPTFSPSSRNTKLFFESIVKRLRLSVEEDAYIPLYPKTHLETKTSLGGVSRAQTFFNRQCWSCIKLLRSVLLWVGILSPGILQEVALHSLLNRYVILALRNSDIASQPELVLDRCDKIISSIPSNWLSDCRAARKSLPGLENLAEFLSGAAVIIDRSQYELNASDILKSQTLARLDRIVLLLSRVGAADHARHVASTYGLQIW